MSFHRTKNLNYHSMTESSLSVISICAHHWKHLFQQSTMKSNPPKKIERCIIFQKLEKCPPYNEMTEAELLITYWSPCLMDGFRFFAFSSFSSLARIHNESRARIIIPQWEVKTKDRLHTNDNECTAEKKSESSPSETRNNHLSSAAQKNI